ncbi:MAG: 30S ribosomal protein S5 alanine N-acetyltransferase, partial [Pseudomonadota bacterium]
QRLLLRCGFKREGLARGYLRINGQWRDHDLFARLADDPEDSQRAL